MVCSGSCIREGSVFSVCRETGKSPLSGAGNEKSQLCVCVPNGGRRNSGLRKDKDFLFFLEFNFSEGSRTQVVPGFCCFCFFFNCSFVTFIS